MVRCALAPLLGCLALGHATAETLTQQGVTQEHEDISSLALVQEQVQLHWGRGTSDDPRNLNGWGYSLAPGEIPAAAPSVSKATQHRNPFEKAIVVSISPEKYDEARERLEAQGVPVEPFWGFNGKLEKDVADAVSLLRKYNNTEHLHQTVGNLLACLHMSPGTPPRVMSALSELVSKVFHGGPGNVQQMLDKDHHHCAPKMVAIAATHVRLWERIANGSIPATAEPHSDPDPWYLIMEDDAALCPGWRQRMEAEVPQIPSDADVVKLFFFGHWRKEDQLPDGPDGKPSPFLVGRDPMKTSDIAKASTYEILKGASFDSVPVAGFYAGTQAYLVKRRSAQKLLTQIKGKPFQDIDMTMMSSVKHYVWRRVLSMSAPADSSKHRSLMQVVPVCNREPPKDWFFR